jgi:hypothetical protein
MSSESRRLLDSIIFDPGDQFENVVLKTSDLEEFTKALEEWDKQGAR